MPITFNSTGGFLAGTISSSGNDIFITTSGSVGAINIGNQTLSGSEVIEKDSTGKIRNKKIFNDDGTITQQKFDANEKITETKVKNPSDGKETFQSASATTNQIEFQQNASGAFITVSGSIPGYNIIKTGATNDYRTIRQTTDFFYANDNAIFTVGVDGVNDKTWFVNPNVGTSASPTLSALRVSASGDVFVKGNIHAQEFHTELISSSIVFQSGSTIFGDTHDDTHTFTGKFVNAITASGNISASGTNHIFGGTIKPDAIDVNTAQNTGYTAVFRDNSGGTNLSINAAGGVIVGGSVTQNAKLNVNGNTSTNSHITASGNISSSGTIIGKFLNVGMRVKAIGSSLEFAGNELDFVDGNSINRLFRGTAGGSFEAYYGGQKKLETTAGGIDVTGHITASGDISASGVIYGKQIQHTYHQFNNDSNASANYIPAPGGYIVESTSINYYRQWLAPYKGKIKKIVVYAENDCGNTRVSLYQNGIFSGFAEESLGATTAVVFDDFTGGLSGNPNFNQHDRLAIAMDPANIPGDVNLVCSWEYEIDS